MFFFPSLVCWNGMSQGSQLCGIFDKNERRPCIGTCGHSVCRQCVRAEPNLRCPVCHVAGAFSEETINYQALELMEVYSSNCVEVYERWWRESRETIGNGCCIHCNDYETLRICVTCELEAINAWTKPILKRKSEDPEDVEEFLLDITVVSAARLQKALQCSDCLAENHEGHRTMKLRDVKNVEKSIKLTSYLIAGKILETNLTLELENNKEKYQSCRLRYLRIKRTTEKLNQYAVAYFAQLNFPPLLQVDFERIQGMKTKVDELLESLKVQWGRLPSSEHKCQCSELWEKYENKNVESLYTGMSFLEPEKNEDGNSCPMDFSWNQNYSQSLKFLTRDSIINPKKGQEVTQKKELKEVKVIAAPELVPYSEYRVLYDHVVKLTDIIEKIKRVLNSDDLELMMEVPQLPDRFH